MRGWTLHPPLTRIFGGRIPVATDAARLFQSFCQSFHTSVETLNSDHPMDDWGWAHRYISGTETWSYHAYGIAVDLNATEHPYGKRGTFTSQQVQNLRRVLADHKGLIVWGGDWSTPDEMHFETRASRSTVAAWRPSARPPTPPPPGARPTVKQGSTGKYVSDVQRVLNAWYPRLARLAVDGVFGAKTAARVRYFQSRAGLVVDGIVGPRTWAALGY